MQSSFLPSLLVYFLFLLAGLQNPFFDYAWIPLLTAFFSDCFKLDGGPGRPPYQVLCSLEMCGLAFLQTIIEISLATSHNLQAAAFPLYFLQPFLGASLGLLIASWGRPDSTKAIPRQYSFISGFIFAVVGMVGRFRGILFILALHPSFRLVLHSMSDLDTL